MALWPSPAGANEVWIEHWRVAGAASGGSTPADGLFDIYVDDRGDGDGLCATIQANYSNSGGWRSLLVDCFDWTTGKSVRGVYLGVRHAYFRVCYGTSGCGTAKLVADE
jgi:hypothetical protein